MIKKKAGLKLKKDLGCVCRFRLFKSFIFSYGEMRSRALYKKRK